MNYTELTSAIKNYTENEETTFVSLIPTFVQQAEQRIFRTVTIPEVRANSTGSLTQGNQYLQRPSDFLAVASIAIVDPTTSEYTYLLDKDVNFIREGYPVAATQGKPMYYGQFDGDAIAAGTHGHFIVGPTPNANYVVELHYYYEPPSIVSTGTSWLGDNADTVLLYGSLLEAYTFMKGEPDIMTDYKERYQSALQQLSVIDAFSKKDSYRDGEPR
tara:strand:- start:187 stop:834 length:648 start_codon:yes stop_codon:yes gene_type:complete